MTTTKTETKGRVMEVEGKALTQEELQAAHELHTLIQLITGEITMIHGGLPLAATCMSPLAAMAPPTWPTGPVYPPW
jgi:hypothetical protein